MTIVCNALGGPGSGKSTMSYGLIAALKARGHKAELVTEVAKELMYRRDFVALANQFEVVRQQDQRLRDLLGQVDVIVMDSSLPLGILYAPKDGPYAEEWFARRTWEMFDGYQNFNVFVRRCKAYETYGRRESLDQAQLLDQQILDLYGDRIDLYVDGDNGAVEAVYEALMQKLR